MYEMCGNILYYIMHNVYIIITYVHSHTYVDMYIHRYNVI